MSALVEVDVTELRRALRERRRNGGKATFLSAVLWAVGRSLAEFPEFNSMRWGKRIATFSGVDINVPVEMRRGGEPVVDCVLIRSAERLSLEEISALVEDFKAKGIDPED
jgi:pyruvate/2-oxoglutarate dehydrogenase complex dihydrolipoamide acyltransferase (E2) component